MGGSNSFRVDPQHVKALRDELQSVQQDIQKFLMENRETMRLPQQAADPVSADAAKAFAANAQQAITEAGKFAKNLQQVVESLDGAANAYQANDTEAAASFPRS